MGIFSYYLGDMDIPEADRPEYARQALAMLRAGGMMSVERIQICGKAIHLFFPPEFDDNGEASGYYNYLDNESWEFWKLSGEKGVFCSNKIGGKCFYHTIIAVNILSSLWSRSYGATTVDGRLVKEEPYIRWINGVLGTGYTNWRATQVWTLEKLLHREDWCAKYNRDLLGLVGTIPVECIDLKQIESYMAACRLDEYLQGAELTQERIDALLKEKSLSMETFYAFLLTTLARYHQQGGTLEGAKNRLVMTAEKRRSAMDSHKRDDLILAISLVSPVVAVAMTAKEFDVDFWSIWDEIGEKIPDVCELKPPEPKPCPPLESVADTHEVLSLDVDDMAYYWTPDAPFQFSEEMTSWMKTLRIELEDITETISTQNFLPTLAANISAADGTFFQDCFYEFIHRQDETAVQKAVILLGRMGKRTDENIRKYVAILGNPQLRERVLGF